MLISGLSSAREMWTYWKESKSLEHLSCEEHLRELGEFNLEKTRLGAGDLIKAYKCRKRGCREDGVMLFSVVTSARTRGNGYELEHRRLLPTTRSASVLCR